MANANSNVANLRQRSDPKRRDEAVADATGQIEQIFGMLLVCVQHERGEIPGWPTDLADLTDIIRALVIRGAALNSGVMSALRDEISIEDMEGLVSHG